MGRVNLSKRIFRRTPAAAEQGASEGAQTAAATGAQAAAQSTQPSGTATNATANEPEHGHARTCPECGAPMADGQQWCTQCGERSNANLRKGAGIFSAGALTIASAVLASGAAAAGLAALTQGSAKEPPHRTMIAQAPVTTSTTTSAAAPAAANPGSPETLRTSRPPASAPVTTKTAAHTSSTASANVQGGTAGAGASATTPTSTATHTTSSTTSAPEVPELQGLTASAYSLNPEYPKASLEGPENDPARALEGRESGTSWTVQIKSGSAEHVNVGLLIALGGPTRVGSVEIHTSTPGGPLEIYGTTSNQLPTMLSEWTRLGLTPKLKASATIKVGETGTHWRYVLLWIPKVPASTRSVALGEVALYPPAS